MNATTTAVIPQSNQRNEKKPGFFRRLYRSPLVRSVVFSAAMLIGTAIALKKCEADLPVCPNGTQVMCVRGSKVSCPVKGKAPMAETIAKAPQTQPKPEAKAQPPKPQEKAPPTKIATKPPTKGVPKEEPKKCGNGVCEPGETVENCPQDCKPPEVVAKQEDAAPAPQQEDPCKQKPTKPTSAQLEALSPLRNMVIEVVGAKKETILGSDETNTTPKVTLYVCKDTKRVLSINDAGNDTASLLKALTEALERVNPHSVIETPVIFTVPVPLRQE